MTARTLTDADWLCLSDIAKFTMDNNLHAVYHAHGHVHDVLDAIAEIQNTIGPYPSDALNLAALFHDVVYIPGAPDGVNEAASSALLTHEWFVGQATSHVSILHEACSLIACTRVSNHMRSTQIDNKNQAILLDADLSSLAATYSTFCNNQSNIILENLGDPEDKGSRVRCGNFLSAFLVCRPFIYHTEYGRANWEAKAKANINRYIEESNK